MCKSLKYILENQLKTTTRILLQTRHDNSNSNCFSNSEIHLANLSQTVFIDGNNLDGKHSKIIYSCSLSMFNSQENICPSIIFQNIIFHKVNVIVQGVFVQFQNVEFDSTTLSDGHDKHFLFSKELYIELFSDQMDIRISRTKLRGNKCD